MIIFRGFILQLMIIALCRAEIFFKSPSMGEVVGPGSYKIHASDSGIVPTLGQFDDASWEVVLFTGNDTAPVSFNFRVDVFVRHRVCPQEEKSRVRKRTDEAMLNT